MSYHYKISPKSLVWVLFWFLKARSNAISEVEAALLNGSGERLATALEHGKKVGLSDAELLLKNRFETTCFKAMSFFIRFFYNVEKKFFFNR